MLKNNEFVGLALDGDTIRIAHLKKKSGVLHLQKLDEVSLVESIGGEAVSESTQNGDPFAEVEQEEAAPDSVFGLEESAESEPAEAGNSENEIDFDELEAEAQTDDSDALGLEGDLGDDADSLDMVDESGEERSNAFVLYNVLARYGEKSIQLGLNIPSGDTIFQIISDTDFKEVKKKDLVEDLELKLESIYDEPPAKDNYNYYVREDGSLILASVKEEAPLLTVLNEAQEYYNGKIRVRSIYPDEAALASLVKENYELSSSDITAVVQFGAKRCRFFFMRGDEILHVAPLINQGTGSSNILNTVFSKLLFELDTGKVPGIDQIIVANNLLGPETIAFFEQNFPNIEVAELAFKEELFQYEGTNADSVSSFSTAIAAAWAASQGDNFSELSFLPDYVEERQKIFKLKWHGIALLCLIFFVPFIFNYFYQQNLAEIDSLSTELDLTTTRIAQIEPIVQQTKQISQDLALLTDKLSLIDSLSTGSKVWSAKFSIINEGMSAVPNSWFTSLTKTQEGTFIEGYTLYRNRVPAIVDIYDEATLLNVSIEKIREQEIYRFSIFVKAFAGDSAAYSPDQPENIRKLLGGNL